MGLFKQSNSPNYWMSFTVNGKQYKRSTGTEDKRIAEAILGKVKSQVVEGKWFEVDEAKKHTFKELVERFTTEHMILLEENTRRNYNVAITRLKEYLEGLTLDQITPGLISQFKGHHIKEGRKLGTIALYLACLSKMFNLAMKEWEWCKVNPVSFIKIGKLNNEIDRWLTYAEEQTLLSLMALWLRELVIFALNTGMRINEILSLKWAEINMQGKTVTVIKTKNKKKRTIPLNQTVYNLLIEKSRVRALSGFVFVNYKGDRHSIETVSKMFNLSVKKSGIPHCRFHDLRHTFATRLAQAGVDLYKISKLLGHSDIKQTQRYAHHCPESLRGGADALDIFYQKEAERQANEPNYPNFRHSETVSKAI